MLNIKQTTSEYLNELNVNSVLDLGCGPGKKSLRFARKGIKVLGIDKENFEISQENFEFRQESISQFEFNKKYDLIIASLVLHYFEKDKAIEIIKNIKNNTSEKGYNFLICMSDEDDYSKRKIGKFFPSISLIKEIYSDWDIIKINQDFTDYEEHGDHPRHRHNLIIVLTQKRK